MVQEVRIEADENSIIERPHTCEHVGETEGIKCNFLENRRKRNEFPNMWGRIFDLEEIRPTLWYVVSQYTKLKFRNKKKMIISFSNKRNKISEKSQKFLFSFTNTGEKGVNI